MYFAQLANKLLSRTCFKQPRPASADFHTQYTQELLKFFYEPASASTNC